MNRELIVNLLQKQIEELKLMTEGFSAMEKYPEAIIKLALIKNDDIRDYLHQLGNLEVQEENHHIQTEVQEEIGGIEQAFSCTDEEAVIAEEIEEQVVEDIQEETVIAEEVEEQVAEEIQEEVDVEVVAIEDESREESNTTGQEQEIEINAETEVVVKDTEIDKQENEQIEITEEEEEFIDETEEEDEEFEEEAVIITPEAEKTTRPTLTRNDIMSSSDVSLNSSIGNKKITDIRQAISIGDRFRFQRELFRNNGEDMNKTLIYINQLASYEEVFGFLQSKYGWETENANADDFYQIVKRKF